MNAAVELEMKLLITMDINTAPARSMKGETSAPNTDINAPAISSPQPLASIPAPIPRQPARRNRTGQSMFRITRFSLVQPVITQRLAHMHAVTALDTISVMKSTIMSARMATIAICFFLLLATVISLPPPSSPAVSESAMEPSPGSSQVPHIFLPSGYPMNNT